MNITLHIERLILDGLPLESRHGPALQAAVEAELARLLMAGGLAPELLGGAALPTISVPHIGAAASESAALGRQIAQAVYGEIGGAGPADSGGPKR